MALSSSEPAGHDFQRRARPIVHLTTSRRESKKQAGRAAGAPGWLVKPFQADQLPAVIMADRRASLWGNPGA
jgi:DNA-binding response OmpR family regulator